MYLQTERLIVRSFTPEDAAGLHAILGDEETMRNCEPAYDFEKTKKFLTEFCIGRNGAVAATGKENGTLLGYILFHAFEEGVYEMGWIFNRRFWRQGYAYEACRAVLDHAFSTLDAHKVFAEAIDGEKSVGLMKKLGMQLEGIQRSQTKDNGGNWADLYFYGILKEDWRKHGNQI